MPRLLRRIRLRLLDLTRLLRPWFILPSIFALMTGVILGLHESTASARWGPVIGGLLVVGPLVAGSSIIFNQVADLPFDSKSPSKRRFPLVRMRFSVRTAYILSFALLTGGVALSIYLGPVVLVATIVAATLAFAYSHPRTRLKETPSIGCVASGVCYGIIPVVVGWSLVAPLKWIALVVGAPLFVVFSSGYMLLCLPEVQQGAHAAGSTMITMWGYKDTIKVSILLVGVSGLIIIAFALLGMYPRSALLVIPVLVSIMAMHWRLLDSQKLEAAFVQIRYLYLVLGIIFLVALTM